MIIDCHTHLGRNHHIEASPKELLLSMDKAGIDKSLVFAGMLNDAPNEWLLDQIAPHKDRLLGVAAAHPMGFKKMSEIQDEARKIADLYEGGQIVACKFYTGYDHYYPFDRMMEDYLGPLEDVGCPAIFHSGDCLNTACHAKLKYAHPLHIDDVAVDYPKMNFIIAHMGYPWHRDAAEVCYKNANVYADVSGFVYGKFTSEDYVKFFKVINEFNDVASQDKLLFGTDWPISDQAYYTAGFERTALQGMSDTAKKVFKL